mmetsp:Transcript_3663/g.8525  ORF Transcript_3663/g.8525 Transcript_3663/m.8525 type:complete len:154 (+) Transcript_3663:628-1089(+)
MLSSSTDQKRKSLAVVLKGLERNLKEQVSGMLRWRIRLSTTLPSPKNVVQRSRCERSTLVLASLLVSKSAGSALSPKMQLASWVESYLSPPPSVVGRPLDIFRDVVVFTRSSSSPRNSPPLIFYSSVCKAMVAHGTLLSEALAGTESSETLLT